VSVHFTLRGFLAAKLLQDRVSFDSCSIIKNIFPEINSEIAKTRPKTQLYVMDSHLGNLSAGNSQPKGNEFDRLSLNKILHPPYSSGISPHRFWFFAFLKVRAKGRQSASRQNRLDAILVVRSAIAEISPLGVHEEWIARLKYGIQIQGE
jgi:hypothetical protein